MELPNFMHQHLSPPVYRRDPKTRNLEAITNKETEPDRDTRGVNHPGHLGVQNTYLWEIE